MKIAKALILADIERDERPWLGSSAPAGDLFPVGNRPILAHALDALQAVGVVEATILAGAHRTDAIRTAIGSGRGRDLDVHIAEWDPADGVSGALTAGRDFVGDDPVVVQHGHALLRDGLDSHMFAFDRERLDALALRLPRQDAAAGPDLTPWYLFSNRAVSILSESPQPARNPVVGIRAGGGLVRIEVVDGCVPSSRDAETLLETNRRVLQGLATSYDPASLDDCTVQGVVDIDPTARVRGSVLRGPVIVGPGARISDAYLGPYTSIGAGVVIEGTEIEHSIVLAGAELRFVGARLESSVIGRRARIVRGFRLPGALRMLIGDQAEVVLT